MALVDFYPSMQPSAAEVQNGKFFTLPIRPTKITQILSVLTHFISVKVDADVQVIVGVEVRVVVRVEVDADVQVQVQVKEGGSSGAVGRALASTSK